MTIKDSHCQCLGIYGAYMQQGSWKKIVPTEPEISRDA